MYFNILKKDLKKKKTMNIILFLFTVLAAMFVSSGLSNVITVMNGTEYYLDKAGLSDYIVMTQNGDGGIRQKLDDMDYIEGYRFEECYWAAKNDIKVSKKYKEMKNRMQAIQSIDSKGITYFDLQDNPIRKVKKGEVYISSGFLSQNDVEVGDKIEIKMGKVQKKLRIAGECKDALLGSSMMGNTRFLINDEDYQTFEQDKSLDSISGYVFYINTDDTRRLASDLSKASHILFTGDRAMIKLSYVMEMIIVMIILVLSICLIIVSFVILKFVITLSINEEMREIGVMKAIGIKNCRIRSLYMVKYLAMSIVGGVVGLVLGIPFGSFLIKSVSDKMVLGNDSGYIINVLGAFAVIVLMAAFTYLCTKKVKKATPVDAIRSGQTGERYKKKSVYRIGKAHTSSPVYMALNDIISSPRRFMTIIFSFLLCSLFVMGVVLVTDTMKSDRLIETFGKKSDVYINDAKLLTMDFMSEEGDEKLQKAYDDIEDTLKRNGIPGKVNVETWFKYSCKFKGKSFSGLFQKNERTKADGYKYTEGSAPKDAGEIAVTPVVAESMGVKIGDTVTIDFGTEKKECMVTAYFETMNQLGNVIRLHEDAPTSMKYASAMMAFQIDFDDHPDDKTIDSRVKKLKKIYDINDVFDARGYCMDCIGVADTMDAVGKLLLVITCIVVVLVTVLMERSFISDETGQIALLKAIGFKESFIMKWQVYRFMLVAVISELLAVALTVPITRLWANPIFGMMGTSDVHYYFNPLTLLLIYPGVILVITLLAIWLTARYARKIKSRDIINIE